MLDVLPFPPTDHELQLLPTAPGADKKKKKKKRSGTMDQGTVIEKNALGLDRACFICQAHCRPDIELRGSGKGMCLLSKREGT